MRAVFFTLVFQGLTVLAPAQSLKIAGSSIVNMAMSDGAQILRTEHGLDIHINTAGGSSAGLAALGDGTADIAMISRALTAEDRASAPEVEFNEIYLGEQVIALAVAADVWAGGVHALTREQVRNIYEQKVTNWKEVGGADQKIAFFNADEGHGTWEMFAQWLYGDNKRAPIGKFPLVSTNAAARDALEFTHGSMTMLSPLFVDGKAAFVLGLREGSAPPVLPTYSDVAARKYPMTRPLYLVVNNKPTRAVKVVVDFMLGARGQALMAKQGFVSAAMLKAAGVKPE